MSKFMKLYESTKTQLMEASDKEKELVSKASDLLKQINAKDDESSDAEADYEHYGKKSYKTKAERLQKQSDKLSDKYGKILKSLWKMDSSLAAKKGLFDGLDEEEMSESIITERTKIKGQPGSVTTQVATTAASVGKAAAAAMKALADGTEVKRALEYGAGKGVGIPKLQEVLGTDVEVKSYEPHPVGWSPDYTDNTSISGKFDIITCTSVINVVPKDIRDAIIKDIASLLTDTGVAAVSSRAWKYDVNLAKNFEEYDKEEKAILVLKKNKDTGEVDKVFQKGYDANELVDYATALLGSKYDVTKNNSFGKSGIIIKKAK